MSSPTSGSEKQTNTIVELQSLPNGTTINQEKQKASMKEKPRVRDIFLKTDIDGLPELYEARTSKSSVGVICWSLIVVFAFTICALEIYMTITDYRDNPILTTYSIVSSPSGVEFPQILLCPTSPIHRQAWLNARVDPQWERKHVKGLLTIQSSDTGLPTVLAQKSSIAEAVSWVFGPEPMPHPDGGTTTTLPPPWVPANVREYFLRVGFPTETFLQECAFGSRAVPCSQLATPVFDGDYGKCFLLRANQSQTVAGVGMSFLINLDMNRAQFGQGDEFEPPLYDGAILRLSESYEIGSRDKMLLQSDTYTKLSLDLTKMKLLETNKLFAGDEKYCLNPVDGRNKLQVIDGLYTVNSCHHDCLQQVAIAECGCCLPVDTTFLRDRSSTVCTVSQLHSCAIPRIQQLNATIRQCGEGCLSPCHVSKYLVDSTSTSFPSQQAKNQMLLELPVEMPKERFCQNEGSLEPATGSPDDNWVWSANDNECVATASFWLFHAYNSEKSCNVVCKVQHPCLITLPSGQQLCGGSYQRFRWDKWLGRCEPFSWDGCNWHANIYESQAECNETCESLLNEVCLQPLFFGQCELPVSYARYGFDFAGCKPFDYSGCGGNGNNFLTEHECLSACEMGENAISNDNCTLQLDAGFCEPELETRYHYDYAENACFTFPFEGCGGNENNFQTAEACRTRCLDSNFDKLATKTKRRQSPNDTAAYLEQLEEYTKNVAANEVIEKWQRGGLILVDIAYSSLQYIDVTQQPSMTFSTFVSNIGGQVGLWVGASIVTMVKFIVVVSPICCIGLGRRLGFARQPTNQQKNESLLFQCERIFGVIKQQGVALLMRRRNA